jgi:midasin (ATPase involved in ribosome maturation)
VSDDAGRLVFQEGLLVIAARQGHWVVLDELNLAPSEVLEALNRCGDKLDAFLWDVPGAAALWPELRQ